MDKEIRYGKITDTYQNGDTTVNTEATYRDFDIAPPIRRRFERRVMVANQKEEIEEYLRFSDKMHKYPAVDVMWRIEHSNRHDNNYYVIECWTELDTELKSV